MHAQGFLDQKTRFPLGMGLAVAIHAAGLTALFLAKNDYIPEIKDILIMEPIPIEPDPAPLPLPPAPKTDVVARTPIDTPTQIVPVTPDPVRTVSLPPAPPLDSFGSGAGILIDIPPIAPPVLTDAEVDGRFARDFQPPYPAGKQRLGEEGLVVVRVLIGADGHVKRVEPVNAADEAFFAATERQALRRWRFRPATRDGVAIESWRTMTVRFEMTG